MSVWQDLRVAVRHLAKSLGATALAVLSIALGIGLTAGMFSVADAMHMRPLPIEKPNELFVLSSRGDTGHQIGYGWPDYLDVAAAGKDIATLVADQARGSTLTRPDRDWLVETHAVTPNYFTVLRVRALHGTPSVDYVGGVPQAVLGYHLWQQRFGGDPRVVGQTILLNKKAFTVAAVMPREFMGLNRAYVIDIWISADAWFHVFGISSEVQARDGQFDLIARLKPGVSPARAGAMLDSAIRGAGKHKPAPQGAIGTVLETSVTGWQEDMKYGAGLLAILAAVLFVACANVAQLRLAQAESGRKELGVRLAMGAGRWRVIRPLLAESTLVSVAGAGMGLVLAQFVMQKANQFLAAGRESIDYAIQLDHRVLAFAAGATLLSVILTGLAPARHAARLDVAEILKAEQGSTGARGLWRRKIPLVGQVAVSVALFGCMVLFVESLGNARQVWPGVDPSKKLLALDVNTGRDATATDWCEPVRQRLAALPGVRDATYARWMPLSGPGGGFRVRVEMPGHVPLMVRENNVAGNYFALLRTRMLAGRAIEPGDRAGGTPVVVISQTLANQLFPDGSALGRSIQVNKVTRQVVGISADAASFNLHKESGAYLYLPYTQAPLGDITLMVETAGEPMAIARAAWQEVARFDARADVYNTRTLRGELDAALSQDTMMASLSTVVAMFGLLLTAAGLFGVLQYSVNRRAREFGLRMALGANPAAVERQVLAESMRVAAWGVPIGLALLALASHYARSRALGVAALDPWMYGLSALAAIAITLIAGWAPARRATRVDPIKALRSE